MKRSIYAFAWDLVDQSRDHIISEFRGIGLNGVTFAGACDMGPVLRLHGRKGRLAFPEDGAVYFRPQAQAYAGIEPRVSQLLDERDVLADITGSRRMSVALFLAPFNNRRLGTDRPDLCCVNAFADHYPHCLAPTNQQIRDYAVELCRDVAQNYAIDEIVLEAPSWLPPDPSWRGPSHQMGRNIWLNSMLSLSFSESDRAGAAKAGIDIEGLRQRIASRVDQYLSSDVDPPFEMAVEWLIDDYQTDPELVAYQRWLADQVRSLMLTIREALPSHVKFAILPRPFNGGSDFHKSGHDMLALEQAADRLEIPLFSAPNIDGPAEVFDMRRRTGHATVFGAVLRVGQPNIQSRDQLEDTVRTALRLGAEGLSFAHYGSLRARELRWIGDVMGTLR